MLRRYRGTPQQIWRSRASSRGDEFVDSARSILQQWPRFPVQPYVAACRIFVDSGAIGERTSDFEWERED
jgi:hypothetical protein